MNGATNPHRHILARRWVESSCSSHREQFLVEALVYRQTMASEILP